MEQLKIAVINRPSIGGFYSRAVRERIIEPLKTLNQQKRINFEVIEEADPCYSILSRFSHLVLSRPYSLASQQWIRAAQKQNIQIICDLDDLPIYRPLNGMSALTIEQIEIFLKLLNECDKITCSTPEISSWIANRGFSKKSFLIETGYDFETIITQCPNPIQRYEKHVLFTNAGPLKLGIFTEDWLELMHGFLTERNLRLAVYADYVDYFPKDFPFDFFGSREWLTHKVEIKGAFPLAVAPLTGYEDPQGIVYSRYKTPTKFICYSGLEIPTIYSKSPIYESVVRHSQNGFLAENTRESWLEQLEHVIQNSAQAQHLAKQEAYTTREKFDINNSAKKWLHAISASL